MAAFLCLFQPWSSEIPVDNPSSGLLQESFCEHLLGASASSQPQSHGCGNGSSISPSSRAARHNLHSTQSTNPPCWAFLLFPFLLLLLLLLSRSSPAPSAHSSSGHTGGVFPMRQKKPTSKSPPNHPPHGILFLLYHLKFFLCTFPTVLKGIPHQIILSPRLLPLISPEQSEVRFPPHPPFCSLFSTGKNRCFCCQPGSEPQEEEQLLPERAASACCQPAGARPVSPGLAPHRSTQPDLGTTGCKHSLAFPKTKINLWRKDPDSRRAPFPAPCPWHRNPLMISLQLIPAPAGSL